jgi:hypothetical protein
MSTKMRREFARAVRNVVRPGARTGCGAANGSAAVFGDDCARGSELRSPGKNRKA